MIKVKGTSQNPIIPQGFKPINTGGAEWEQKTDGTKGLVIQDSNEKSVCMSLPVQVAINDTIQTKLDNGKLTVAISKTITKKKLWAVNQTSSKLTTFDSKIYQNHI